MKKKFLFLFLFMVLLPFFTLFPTHLHAACTTDVCTGEQVGGIVPCARPCDNPNTIDNNETCPCTLCHFFLMIDNILDFVLFTLVPVAAVLMLVIGGAMFLLAAGNPGMLEQAKSLIRSVLLGLLIVYASFLVLGIFLMVIGLNVGWTQDIFSSWWEEGFFQIDCNPSP